MERENRLCNKQVWKREGEWEGRGGVCVRERARGRETRGKYDTSHYRRE